ncbi:MAG TPA: hypothetical protein VN618_06570 [Solirubrobacteraceae bacterium]|nr:hypothetical protein [Solirubrobacteraceae bacterium]
MSEDLNPLSFLNGPERRLLGPLVARLCATGNARFQQAIETTGAEATVRMACVNALRIYAIVLFVLGSLGRLAHLVPVAYTCFVLAGACMVWSFWCLYTVVGPEREHKRLRASNSPLS